jgi:hypothetical protein
MHGQTWRLVYWQKRGKPVIKMLTFALSNLLNAATQLPSLTVRHHLVTSASLGFKQRFIRQDEQGFGSVCRCL